MLRPPRGLCLLLLVLASANIARSTVVGDDWQFIFNVAIGILALAIGITSGQSLSELGLDTSSLKRGLNYGAVPFAIISAIMIVLGLVGVLNDDRTDVSLLQMLLRVLVVIPIGTVLVEEIAFRGTLDALLRKSFGDGIRSLVLGAVIFGAWHVFPTWLGGGVDTGSNRFVTTAITFLATALFGAILVWLRRKSGSLVAPALAHLATNSVTFAVAWIAS